MTAIRTDPSVQQLREPKKPKKRRLCTRCRQRWQKRKSYCHRCARIVGLVVHPTTRRPKPAVEMVPDTARRNRRVVIGGVAYEVVFDGA